MDIDDMTDEELAEAIANAQEELARRQSLEAVRKQMGASIDEARGSGVLKTPAPGTQYVPPTDATELCIAGDYRTYEGETWVLERGACVGPPSEANGWKRAEIPVDQDA